MLAKTEDVIDGMGPINSRTAVRALMPKLEKLLDSHMAYLAANSREEKALKAKRNAVVATFTDDERNAARLFVASLGCLMGRWI